MKRLKIFILTLSISLYFPTYSFAYTELECSQLAAKAKTEWAAKKISLECGPRDSFFSKSHDLKCAIKAGEATTEWAAKKIMVDCQYMTQGYIIQFYHPIEADLPEDIREDWMQWHHEELIRDNKVFETVQLKLDIQNLGMPFSFLYSRKDKVFTTEEQNTIDKICRNLGEYTKKKFKMNFSIDENRDYGSTWTDKYGEQRDRVTQTMNYEYIFSDCKFNLQVNKLFALNNKESKTLLEFGQWDKRHLNLKDNGQLNLKNVKVKDISGITLVSNEDFKKRDPKFWSFGRDRRSDLMSGTILITYNSKWQIELEKEISRYFKSIAKHLK